MDKLIITEHQFKTYTPVSSNLQISSPLTPIILDAQIRYIKPILCDDVYDALQALLPNVVDVNYLALMDKITPCLAQYALYVGIPYFSVKIREVGVVQQTGDRTSQLDISWITYMRADALSSAEMYAIELKKYLLDNKSLFPVCDDCDGNVNRTINNRFFMNI